MEPEELKERFRSYTEKTDGCWLWKGGKHVRGYGQFTMLSRTMHAHRAAWILFKGVIPEGFDVHHRCKIRDCVNPSHLELLSHVDHGRLTGLAAASRSKTHCPHGHPYSAENTRIWGGKRYCWTCARANAEIQNAKQRGERRSRTNPTIA